MAASDLDVAASPLTLRLFGPLDARVQGRPLPPLRTRKGQWLLALLVLRQGRQVDRDWLAGTLWPESDQSQAYSSLRRTLTDLRQALGPEADRLTSPTRQTLSLDLAGACVDVLEFDSALANAERESLEKAIALYRGPLLEGCVEEWVLPEREARQQAYLQVLETLADRAMREQDPAAAIGALRRAVAADPLRESAQRQLMQALAADGDYAAAVQAYRELRLLLRQELHTDPAPETTALFQQIRERTRRQVPGPPPALSTATPPAPARLPHPVSRLLGREKEVAEILRALSDARLVTLTGTGGVGKTRLAIQVAEESAEDYADGVTFVDFTPLSDPALVGSAVAGVLELPEEASRPVDDTLCASLRGRQLLLLLDNCEHLLAACASLAGRLLQDCPQVKILATSRQPLGIVGEVTWRVPSLSVPDLASLPIGEKERVSILSEYEAIQLFVERARQANPSFQMTAENADTIAQLCLRLDGIPLAIELAAARTKVLSVEQIAARLDDRFRLLTGGSPVAPARQQTLQRALDWSYALLTPPEQVLLQRLSVFPGRWTLEAAEQVCAFTPHPQRPHPPTPSPSQGEGEISSLNFPLAHREADSQGEGEGRRTVPKVQEAMAMGSGGEGDFLDLLTSLVDKSLVMVETGDNRESQYRLLETIRQYAREKLAAGGQARMLQERLFDYGFALTEAASTQLRGPEQTQWLAVLDRQHDTLRAALEWSQATGHAGERRLKITSALGRFWLMKGYCTEGRKHLQEALSAPEAQTPTAFRARALNWAGALAAQQGDYPAARAFYEESLAIYEDLGDTRGLSIVLNNLGLIAHDQGDYAIARALYERSLGIDRELGDPSMQAAALNNLARVHQEQGDYALARRSYEECLAVEQELGHHFAIASSLNNLATIAEALGDYEKARRLCEESLALRQEINDRQGISQSLLNLGTIAAQQGDYTAARSFLEQSLAMKQQLGERQEIGKVYHYLGYVAEKMGDRDKARALYARSLQIRGEIGDKPGIAHTLESLAGLEAERGKAAEATRLFGAATMLREAIGAAVTPDAQEERNGTLAALRAQLGEEAFALAWSEGCRLSTPWENDRAASAT